MDKRASSRSGAADETRTRTTHPSTKPLTRPTAPRLSTSSRPATASSAAKTVAGGSLSKPPARPTTTTVRRPPSATATPVSAAHHPKPSVSSVDERPSGDEKSKAGISARPKRASLAPSSSAERSSTLKNVAATPARRTTIAPSTSTRQSIASPTGARKVPSTPSVSRTAVAPRSRPLTSSTSRNLGAGALAEKKRLSTIPASPAVKTAVEEPEDNKENAASHGEEEETEKKKAPVRPALGSRQSTRSVLIEQKIREFELVNTMLQAAMTADGADGEDQESINQETSSIIAKLKSDLAKVRQFERDHGRMPTEAELEETQSVKEDLGPSSPVEDDRGQGANAQDAVVTELQNELAQSKAHADALQRELIELKTTVDDSNRSAEAESRRVQEATEAVRAEHAAKIEELTSLHQDKVQELESSQQKTLQELRDTQQSGAKGLEETFTEQLAVKESELERLRSELDEVHEAASVSRSSKEAEVEKLLAELEELRAATAKEQAIKDAEIEALKLDLESRKIESETDIQAAPSPSNSPASGHAQELADAQQKLEAAKARHLAAKDNAKSKIAKLQEEFDNKVTTLEAQHKEQIGEAKDKLDHAESEVSQKQEELARQHEEYAKISDEMARQSQVIQVLKSQVLDFQQASKVESDTQTALITQLQEEIKALRQEKTDQATEAASSLAAAEKAHSEKLEAIEDKLRQAQEELKKAETLHEDKLREVLEKSADDLKATNAELDSSKAAHADKLQAIEAELQKVHESAARKQGEHEEALAAVRSQLEAANLALDEAVTKHATLLKEHESTRNAADAGTAELKAAHDKELDRLRAEFQTKHEEEIAALKGSHAENVQQLEQKLHASQKEVAAVKETHSAQIKQLEQQMKASLADLESLETGHIEELNRVKAETEQLQQKAAEEAELKHIERVRQLEQKLNTTEAELSKAQSTYAKQLEDLDRRNLLDQSSALDALKESHASIVSDLEDQLRTARAAIETTKADHADQLKQSEHQLATRHAEDLELLRASHAQELEKIESKAKLNGDQALEEVRSNLLEENRQLESQSRSLRTDLDMTRFQIQSLKGILQSMEDESKEKDEEHAASLEKVEQDLSMSVMKLAEQSARMMDLQMQHDQALAEAKAAVESQSQQRMESLRADHDKALAELRSTLENEHRQLTEKIRDEHAKSVEASQSSHQSEHDELQQKLKEEHASQLDEVLKTLENQWKAQVDLLEEQNAAASARLAQTIKDHEEALQATKSEHEAAVAKLQSQLQEAHGAAPDQTELDGLRSQLVDVQEQLQEITKKHADAMTVIQDRESTLAVIKEELRATQDAAKHKREPAEVEELNSKFVAARKDLEESHDAHDRAVRDIKAEYDIKLEKILSELKVAKEATERAQVPDKTGLETVTASLDDAKKTIASLQADLDGALLEVETQRTLADDSQKEVDRLKQFQKQAEAVTLTSPKPRRKSKSPKRKSMNPLSPLSPGAGKPGLESSKWATAQDEDKDAVPSAADAAASHQGRSGEDEIDPATESTPKSPDQLSGASGKRNVAGQLAGIQEQIKQLDDLSEDFLEDHQKMASMLSRVDDDTTRTSTVQVEEDPVDE